MNRKPSKMVKKILRKENGYKCCYPDCRNPYLEYHHFDPPWHVKNHHNPNGMIALCPTHHRKADAEIFTRDQLMEMKKNAKLDFKNIQGDFEWMRRKVLLIAGGNFYYNNKISIKLRNKPLIWFKTDERGYKLLNLMLHNINGELILHIENNIWIVKKDVVDVECPPSGKELKIYFENGNNIRLRFSEITSQTDKILKYPALNDVEFVGDYPLSTLSVSMKLKSYEVDFQARKTIINGKNGVTLSNCYLGNNYVGLSL